MNPYYYNYITAMLRCDGQLKGLLLLMSFVMMSCHPIEAFKTPNVEVPIGEQSCRISSNGDPWWTIFHDKKLNSLEKKALLCNQDLMMAAANIDRSRALLSVSEANQSPWLTFGMNIQREELTKSQQYSQLAPNRKRDIWTSSGMLSYEVDLWGKLRFQSDASRADLMNSMAARDAMWLRLSSEVALTYISVCTWHEKCNVIRNVYESYEKTCAMYEKRFELGQYSELALRRVQAERAKTLAQLENAKNSLAQAESALSVLVGDSPKELWKDRTSSEYKKFVLVSPPAIPSGIPSNLISQRPDLFELESRLKSAHYHSKVAYYDQFPSFFLTADLGQSSLDLEKLLNQTSRMFHLGGNLLQTVFDGGKKNAYLDVTSAEYKILEATYKQAVMVAFTELHDALVEHQQSMRIYEATNEEVGHLRRSWDIASKQYEAGYLELMDALDTHRSLLNGELALADAAQMRLSAVIKVCKALGGDWKKELMGKFLPTK